MDYGIAQGFERATGNIAATGMKLMEFQANKQIAADKLNLERDRLKIVQDQGIREQQAFDNAEKKRVEQETIDNAFTPVSMVAPGLGKTPTLRNQYIEAVKSAGFKVNETADGEIYVQNRAINHIKNLMATNTAFQKASLDNSLADLTGRSVTLSQQLAEAQSSGKSDEKTLAPLLQEQKMVKEQIAAIMTVQPAVMEAILKEQAKARTVDTVPYRTPTGETILVDEKDPRSQAVITEKKLVRSSDFKPEGANQTEEQLIARALKGDKEASAILKAMQDRRLETARESRSQPQQSQFIDPASGNPLVYDRSSGTYRVAEVAGGGGVSPRLVNPSAGEREKGAQFEVIRDQLKRIKQTYKSEYVGLVAGQIGRVTQWKNADEAAFRQVILDVKDSLLRARSGAQINEEEYKRLAKLVPDFTDSEAQFEGKMKSFENTFNTIVKEREKGQRKGGVYIRGANTSLPEGLKAGW